MATERKNRTQAKKEVKEVKEETSFSISMLPPAYKIETYSLLAVKGVKIEYKKGISTMQVEKYAQYAQSKNKPCESVIIYCLSLSLQSWSFSEPINYDNLGNIPFEELLKLFELTGWQGFLEKMVV